MEAGGARTWAELRGLDLLTTPQTNGPTNRPTNQPTDHQSGLKRRAHMTKHHKPVIFSTSQVLHQGHLICFPVFPSLVRSSSQELIKSCILRQISYFLPFRVLGAVVEGKTLPTSWLWDDLMRQIFGKELWLLKLERYQIMLE